MKTQVMHYTDTAVQELGTIIRFPKDRDIKIVNKIKKGTIKIKALSEIKQQSKTREITEQIIKRTVDICAGLAGTVLLIPLTIGIYIANKICGDGGPIFYFQDRIGKDGKIFKMPKYRSMLVGADEKLEEYLNSNEEARLEFKKYKKLKNDPRITKIGKFIRKTSIDEMPQLILLLTGKMSLVGPRPYLPKEKEDMGEYYDIIIKHKPGITGLWQVRGRSNATFEDRLDFDVMYNKEHSIILDLKILFKTFKDVIVKEGAI